MTLSRTVGNTKFTERQAERNYVNTTGKTVRFSIRMAILMLYAVVWTFEKLIVRLYLRFLLSLPHTYFCQNKSTETITTCVIIFSNVFPPQHKVALCHSFLLFFITETEFNFYVFVSKSTGISNADGTSLHLF